MASFMFHLGYAVRSEKFVVPQPTFVVAGYAVHRDLLKKIAFHFNKIMRLTIIMPKAMKKIKAPSKMCVCLVL